MVPYKGTFEMINEVTRAFSSHVTPEKEQCEVEALVVLGFGGCQSSNPDVAGGANMDDLSFRSASRSESACVEVMTMKIRRGRRRRWFFMFVVE
ncbi:hypothetical protein HanRHA438_Chr14g0634631 [Helianthus annuus]|nr:hypothetical protein HanIR_Chr14g0676221 [Helianthus annuus]KAJ0852126.1 hypothetical protein HanRHA438_Chr14g0634631 [Helianthus annuus]